MTDPVKNPLNQILEIKAITSEYNLKFEQNRKEYERAHELLYALSNASDEDPKEREKQFEKLILLQEVLMKLKSHIDVWMNGNELYFFQKTIMKIAVSALSDPTYTSSWTDTDSCRMAFLYDFINFIKSRNEISTEEKDLFCEIGLSIIPRKEDAMVIPYYRPVKYHFYNEKYNTFNGLMCRIMIDVVDVFHMYLCLIYLRYINSPKLLFFKKGSSGFSNEIEQILHKNSINDTMNKYVLPLSKTEERYIAGKKDSVDKYYNEAVKYYEENKNYLACDNKKEIIETMLDDNLARKMDSIKFEIKYEYQKIIPELYIFDENALNSFISYLYYGRAATIGECINLYENKLAQANINSAISNMHNSMLSQLEQIAGNQEAIIGNQYDISDILKKNNEIGENRNRALNDISSTSQDIYRELKYLNTKI